MPIKTAGTNQVCLKISRKFTGELFTLNPNKVAIA
jgi:hypothetical protein